MWGIGMVGGVGGVAVHGDNERRRHPVVALSYGAGLALIVDEFALLLDLKDVYGVKEGRISVDLGIGLSSLAGMYFAALPLLRALRHRPGARKAIPRAASCTAGRIPPPDIGPVVPRLGICRPGPRYSGQTSCGSGTPTDRPCACTSAWQSFWVTKDPARKHHEALRRRPEIYLPAGLAEDAREGVR